MYPLNAMSGHSKTRTTTIIVCSWVVPALLCLPNLAHHNQSFTLTSSVGTVDGQICQDSFDSIDAMFGHSAGSFRLFYITLLFVCMYVTPLVTILVTCARIAVCLLKPVQHERDGSYYSDVMSRRREESKKKVRAG